jgi:hypothetical protein
MLDSMSTGGLFSSLAPFHHSSMCAMVTQGKRLHIHSFDDWAGTDGEHEHEAHDEGEQEGEDEQEDEQFHIPNFRVLQLLVDWDDTRILALGTASASQRVRLLQVALPAPGAKNAVVTELADLPDLWHGDHDTLVARLSDVGDPRLGGGQTPPRTVVVAALGEGRRRPIYQIPLGGRRESV